MRLSVSTDPCSEFKGDGRHKRVASLGWVSIFAGRLGMDLETALPHRGSEANKLIAKAREELTALSSLLEGLAQKEFPLSKDSHIPAFLPSKSTFQLLDEYAQESDIA
ncbi:hypothetical protein BC829DRAFT_97796 [Chytridium lagenaria]|nr:hypothetical protein BC829DRAFT_97796 [Chytridium lagenaria]